MTAIAATPAGANRPEFAPSLGLDRYFPNPTGALLYSIGNAIGSVASSVGNFFKEQVGERFSNLVQSRGFRTNDQFYAEVGQMIGSLRDGSDLSASSKSAGSRSIKLTPEQQKVMEQLKEWNIASDAFDNKLILNSGVDIEKLGKNISKDAIGLQLLRRHVSGANTIDENFNVITKDSDRAALQRWGAYVNGHSEANFVSDGDGIAMDAKGKMIPLNSKAKIAAYLQGQRAPVLLTQNGYDNTIMDAVGMMTTANQVARADGAFKGTNLMLFNDTEGLVGDTKKYNSNGEESQKTMEYLLQQGVFKSGDILIGHSQGAQILTNAIDANKKLIHVDLYLFGGAHTKIPNNFVDNIMDFRNANDPVASHKVAYVGPKRDLPNPSVNNYTVYEQEIWPQGAIWPGKQWGAGTANGKYGGGSSHGFSDNYLDALQWYLANKKGSKF